MKKNITELPSSRWADELPMVIWFHNTSKSHATKFFTFRLLYGEEAVTPKQIKLGSCRTEDLGEEQDMASMLNACEELRLQAISNSKAY